MSVELLRAADTGVDPEGAELDYVARARELLPLIAEAAAGVEAGRRLDDGVVAALHEAGLFRMMMPRWLGGGEAPPSEFVQVIETIARADASTAWCLSQMTVCSLSSVYLDRDAAKEVFGGTRAALAWGSTPDAKAVRVSGGYRVTGKWEFGSGCHHATWLGGHIPVVEPDGTPVLGRGRRAARTHDAVPESGGAHRRCLACAGPARHRQRPLYARRLFHPAKSTRSPRCSAGPTRRG